jgi:hypothetical protein
MATTAERSPALKVLQFTPPLVALIVVVAWNVSRWRAVSEQKSTNQTLRERVNQASTAKNSSGRASNASERAKRVGIFSESMPLDWRAVAEKLREAEMKGIGDFRSALAMKKRLSAMSSEELLAALNEVASLGLDPEEQARLEEMLVEPLIEKDPELALKTFANRLQDDDDGVAWQLSSAFSEWVKKDRAGALAWFDSQIAAGTFESKSLDGQSQARLEFEAALVGSLLGSDFDLASQRIAALPEEQRREALEQIPFADLDPASQKAYAELVRSLIPQDEHDGSFTHVISELVPDGGYEKVDAFLDSIQATTEEREVSAREAANSMLQNIAEDRPVTQSDVDEMRRWLDKQAPGTKDRVTGESLADAAQDGGEFSFADASKLALQYNRQGKNDEVLVAFLESFAARSNLEEALPLVDKISNPKQRERILDKLN